MALKRSCMADPSVDESYQALKKLVDSGDLGETHAVQTDCLDQQDPTGKCAHICPSSRCDPAADCC